MHGDFEYAADQVWPCLTEEIHPDAGLSVILGADVSCFVEGEVALPAVDDSNPLWLLDCDRDLQSTSISSDFQALISSARINVMPLLYRWYRW